MWFGKIKLFQEAVKSHINLNTIEGLSEGIGYLT